MKKTLFDAADEARAAVLGVDEGWYEAYWLRERRPAKPGLVNRVAKSLVAYWASRGLSARTRRALAYANCRNAEQARSSGKPYFSTQANCGTKTLTQIEHMIGGWLTMRGGSDFCMAAETCDFAKRTATTPFAGPSATRIARRARLPRYLRRSG
jgi:hypothetical protein